jgi:hypothetical protein
MDSNKKEYHSPKLAYYGTVSDITKTMPRPAPIFNDGGGGLNFYMS